MESLETNIALMPAVDLWPELLVAANVPLGIGVRGLRRGSPILGKGVAVRSLWCSRIGESTLIVASLVTLGILLGQPVEQLLS